jgi:hypothetical protein
MKIEEAAALKLILERDKLQEEINKTMNDNEQALLTKRESLAAKEKELRNALLALKSV